MVYDNRSCFVPGCRSGYRKARKENSEQGILNAHLFKATTEAQREKWRQAIPRQDRTYEAHNVVCELHFLPEEISRHFETKMPDGSIHRILRMRPKLSCDAVPSIFPNLPKYLSRNVRPRKPHSARVPIIGKPQEMGDDVGHHVELEASMDYLSDQGGASLSLEREPDFSELQILADVATSCEPVPENATEIEFTAFRSVKLPGENWGLATVGSNGVFLRVGEDFSAERVVIVSNNLQVKVLFRGKEVNIPGVDHVTDCSGISAILTLVHDLEECLGVAGTERSQCQGFLERSRHRAAVRCPPCAKLRRQMVDKLRKKKVPPTKPLKSASVALKVCRIQKRRLATRIMALHTEVQELKNKCSLTSEEAIAAELAALPESQHEGVKAIFAASKLHNSKGRRYTLRWVYECLLLRIKSKKAYNHLRANGILCLPSLNTLSKYMKTIKGAYGFQQAIFDCMKVKAEGLPSAERRGALLLDEMKLSKGLAFDKHTLKFEGFTDLGDYTPSHQANEMGDHALVFMFQPFRGRWVQVLACFLSKGCASSTVLRHLILECVILLERAGYFVDVITCDGAQWNRSMWRLFDVDETEGSCEHPCHSTRKLWFCSDFPHLLKNLRNFVVNHEEIWTPDGVVKLRHWDAVLDLEQHGKHRLKACPKLTRDHVHPKPYQKMNVAKAFQFFGRDVAAAMEAYRSFHTALDDSEASINFIKRVKALATALNSRTPGNALRRDSEEWKTIQNFIDYLKEWEAEAVANSYHFMSKNTCVGFKVTLNATLGLFKYLEGECGFQYLMTARMNQDALERFFGMMRAACGSNDHPDSILFVQLFRLLGTYSLVKPCRGSNVSGPDILGTIMRYTDISPSDNRKAQYQAILDGIVENGVSDGDNLPNSDETSDHSYTNTATPDFVTTYFAGYVARKAMRFTTCEECKMALTSRHGGALSRENFVNHQNQGHLRYASDNLFSLIKELEGATVRHLDSDGLGVDTVLQVATEIESLGKITLVGCTEHCHELTELVVNFFITTRMFFACKVAKDKDNASLEATRLNRKRAKL